MKTSGKITVLALFFAIVILISGCVTTEKYTELSGELSEEERRLAAEKEGGADSVDEEGIDEELLEEGLRESGREIPDILKDDPVLIELAQETGALYTIYFGYDLYSIGSSFIKTIKKNAHWIRSNPDVSIVIEGHADERGGNEYNLALSQRRAQSIEKFLSDFGVNKRKLTILSYGEEKPANDEHSEDAWKENRRVEIKIIE